VAPDSAGVTGVRRSGTGIHLEFVLCSQNRLIWKDLPLSLLGSIAKYDSYFVYSHLNVIKRAFIIILFILNTFTIFFIVHLFYRAPRQGEGAVINELGDHGIIDDVGDSVVDELGDGVINDMGDMGDSVIVDDLGDSVGVDDVGDSGIVNDDVGESVVIDDVGYSGSSTMTWGRASSSTTWGSHQVFWDFSGKKRHGGWDSRRVVVF